MPSHITYTPSYRMNLIESHSILPSLYFLFTNSTVGYTSVPIILSYLTYFTITTKAQFMMGQVSNNTPLKESPCPQGDGVESQNNTAEEIVPPRSQILKKEESMFAV